LVAEERDRLAKPELPEVALAEKAHGAGRTVSGLSSSPSPRATPTSSPPK
jgi:hypothetical protein